MKKYYLIMGVYLAFVFISPEIYELFYDIDSNDRIYDEYIQDIGSWDELMTFTEWLDQRDEKTQITIGWLNDEFDCAMNPWYDDQHKAS